MNANQVGGVNLDGYVACLDINLILGVSDGKLAILALELIQLLIVLGGGKFDGAALLLVLNNLYMTHPAHVYLFEGRYLVGLGYYIVTGLDLIAGSTPVA